MRLTTIFALLALWVPATSHTLLEQAGWIHHEEAEHVHSHEGDADHHHHHPPVNDHDAADGICRVESRVSHAPLRTEAVLWVVSYAFWGILDSFNVEPGFSGPSPPGTAPPEVESSWRFSYRAAVPARAPSSLS